jgi:uncharacterized damage-inducible protein DinB
MDLLSYLRKLFAYESWADREVLQRLRSCATPPGRSRQIFAHIVAVQDLYLSRLLQDGRSIVVWPDLALDECDAELVRLGSLWRAFFSRLTPSELDRVVPYSNSLGESWQNGVRDMLMHVVLHSSYHRGQIASLLGAAGGKAPYTDFIHSIRQGLVDRDF